MDQKAKHIEYMVQFAHSAYLKYQESVLEAFQPSQQKLTESQQKLAEVKQASIELAGLHLESQEGQVKQMEEQNQRKGTELKKIMQGKKRTCLLKMQQDFEAFLQPQQILKEVQSSKTEAISSTQLPNTRSAANRAR